MAAGRGYYAVERCGRRDGYVAEDVWGEVPRGGTADAGVDGDEDWERGPEVLGSTVLSGEVLEKWSVGCEVGFSCLGSGLRLGSSVFVVGCGGM